MTTSKTRKGQRAKHENDNEQNTKRATSKTRKIQLAKHGKDNEPHGPLGLTDTTDTTHPTDPTDFTSGFFEIRENKNEAPCCNET